MIGVLRRTVVSDNSLSQDSYQPDDLFQSRYATPGFKPFSYIVTFLLSVFFSFRPRVLSMYGASGLFNQLSPASLSPITMVIITFLIK